MSRRVNRRALPGGALAAATPLAAGAAVVQPLPHSLVPAPPPGALSREPSFDCRKARMPVEKLICGDADLAALDRRMAALYREIESPTSPLDQRRRRAERVAQRAWLVQRNGCVSRAYTADCVARLYQQRIVGLRIAAAQLTPTTVATYRCPGLDGIPVTGAYYASDPPAVRFTVGTRQALAFAEPTASGTRYTANGVEIREHQREVRLRWFGRSFVCGVEP
ncbi:MAG: MliC family protein [Burkholderiaceae bacterium]